MTLVVPIMSISINAEPLATPISQEPQRDKQPETPVLPPKKEADAINESESFKKEPKPRSYDYDEVARWLYRNHGSHERLPALLEVADEMEREDWFRLLGDAWSGFDNVGYCANELTQAICERLIHCESTISEMMSPEEQVAYDTLPEQITIYRGCGPNNNSGCSWTLDREVAMKLPFMRRYTPDHPILLTATISKHRAAALKLDRNEREVIVFSFYGDDDSFTWTEEPILRDPAGNLLLDS